jgi:hypothetical protein
MADGVNSTTSAYSAADGVRTVIPGGVGMSSSVPVVSKHPHYSFYTYILALKTIRTT